MVLDFVFRGCVNEFLDKADLFGIDYWKTYHNGVSMIFLEEGCFGFNDEDEVVIHSVDLGKFQIIRIEISGELMNYKSISKFFCFIGD